MKKIIIETCSECLYFDLDSCGMRCEKLHLEDSMLYDWDYENIILQNCPLEDVTANESTH